MKNFQHGQLRPEPTNSSSGQANDGQNDLTAANQTATQNGRGDAVGTNQSTLKDLVGTTDQTGGKRSAANVNQNVQALAPQAQAPQAQATQQQAPQAKTSQAQGAQAASQSSISQAAQGKRLGAKFVLPGESGNQYYLGLASTIEALGAKSQMEVYLAEKIFICIWSMNRYEAQKRASLIAEMVKALQDGFFEKSDTKLALTQLLEAGMWDEPAIKKVMQTKGFTESGLTQRAMERRLEEIMQLDAAIAVKAHTLKALQKSYELFACRPILQERLRLQNELLKRDLQAIDLPVLKATSRGIEPEKEKPQASVRKSTVRFSESDWDSQEGSKDAPLDAPLDERIVDVHPKDVEINDVSPNDTNSSGINSNGFKSRGIQTKGVKTKSHQPPKPSAIVNNRDSL